jgi:hypothetical protein
MPTRRQRDEHSIDDVALADHGPCDRPAQLSSRSGCSGKQLDVG